jgi:phage-related protein
VNLPRLGARFFRTAQGHEPVREWLKNLPDAERKQIGNEIRAMQFGWPVGMPLVRKLQADLWEVRIRMKTRIARVLFTVDGGDAVLLHGFIKQGRRLPQNELATAVSRLKQLLAARPTS